MPGPPLRLLLAGLPVLAVGAGAFLFLRRPAPAPASVPDDAGAWEGSPPGPSACGPRGPSGSVVLEPAPDADIDAIVDEFRRRNPEDWHAVTHRPRKFLEAVAVDAIARVLQSAQTPEAGRIATGATLSPVEREARARDFVRRNAELFGLRAGEVDLLESEHREMNGEIRLRATLPRPGYEAFPSVARAIDLRIDVRSDGAYLRFHNASPVLPAFDLCTIPRLRPDDPALRRAVVGRDLRIMRDFGGPLSLGPVTGADLTGSPQLTVHVQRPPEEPVVVTLAYTWTIPRETTLFLLTVDANTGDFLDQRVQSRIARRRGGI